MNNEITHKEKLDFNKKFNEQNLQTKLNDISTKTARVGIHTTAISLMVSGVLGTINPWLLFLLIPSSLLPVVFLKISNNLQNREIKKINKKFSMKMVEEMQKSTEWYLLCHENSAKQLQNQKPIQTKSSKQYKQIKKPNLSNQKSKKHYEIDDDLLITYAMLRDFADSMECSLVEFSPLPTFTYNNSYYVVLGRNNYKYEFEVSNKTFSGIYETSGVDFTERWLEFLESMNQKNTID